MINDFCLHYRISIYFPSNDLAYENREIECLRRKYMQDNIHYTQLKLLTICITKLPFFQLFLVIWLSSVL